MADRGRDAAQWGLRPKARFLTQLLLNDHPQLVVTSGRRTRLQNLRIKGATLNGHTSGNEVDVDGPLPVLQAAERQARLTPGTWTLIHDVQPGPGGLHLHIRWPA